MESLLHNRVLDVQHFALVGAASRSHVSVGQSRPTTLVLYSDYGVLAFELIKEAEVSLLLI